MNERLERLLKLATQGLDGRWTKIRLYAIKLDSSEDVSRIKLGSIVLHASSLPDPAEDSLVET